MPCSLELLLQKDQKDPGQVTLYSGYKADLLRGDFFSLLKLVKDKKSVPYECCSQLIEVKFFPRELLVLIKKEEEIAALSIKAYSTEYLHKENFSIIYGISSC